VNAIILKAMQLTQRTVWIYISYDFCHCLPQFSDKILWQNRKTETV